MAINTTNHMPAVSFETGSGVISEPTFNVTVDGDPIVIIESRQFAQLHGTRQRANLVRDAFHHATVTHKCIGVVINNIMARAVKLRAQRAFCNRKTYCVSNALTQWAGSGFYASGIAIFRVTWRFRMQLAEVFQFFHRQIIASEVQQAIDQHRAVTIRQDETVTISPVWIGWIMVQVITPQNFGNICHAHRGAGVAGIRFLHCVHA